MRSASEAITTDSVPDLGAAGQSRNQCTATPTNRRPDHTATTTPAPGDRPAPTLSTPDSTGHPNRARIGPPTGMPTRSLSWSGTSRDECHPRGGSQGDDVRTVSGVDRGQGAVVVTASVSLATDADTVPALAERMQVAMTGS